MVRDWVLLLRPAQWTKNGFVLAPLLFSGRSVEAGVALIALTAMVAFCLTASGVYALNDIMDRVEDRAHPVKRSRPVAAGRISVRSALGTGTALVIGGVTLASMISLSVGVVLGSYALLAGLYMIRLKHVVLLDVFSIGAFFVQRLLVGSAAIGVQSSFWLLLCGGLLALYLGFAKRRHELGILGTSSSDHRRVLSHYSAPFLDQMSGVLLAVTLVSYLMFSQLSSTAAAVGTDELGWSTVFVLYGLFRYLYLVHVRAQGTPTDTILADKPLLVAVGCWLAYCAWLVYR
ncbi:MAG: UbiA prenyltransferase family protein [Gemmatimonadaceae bacterium]